ncbi:MAG: metallopeptidase family protein [Pseudomonadota bacterium]
MGQRIPNFPTTRWPDAVPPTLDEMLPMAVDALKELPEPFLSLLDQIAIRVSDFPDPEILSDLDIDSPFDLLGLFVGEGIRHDLIEHQGSFKNAIWLYRRAILDYWIEHEQPLGSVVRHVVMHELGYQIGLSEEDLDRYQMSA